MPAYQLHTIDLHFQNTPQVIASYALVGATSAALIETGPGSTLPALLEGLKAIGLTPADVRQVLLTHIHLDHAGAAGWWAQQGATVYVHPLGAPHVIDPSKLIASATRIYGDNMERLWGKILTAPAERVRVVNDGDELDVAGARIRALDTPGHARHHHCYIVDDVAFTGDVAGVRLQGYDWIALPSPPPEFDLEAWRDSLARLAALTPSALYPTHYGKIADPKEHLARYAPFMEECAAFVRARLQEGHHRDEVVEGYRQWLLARAALEGVAQEVQEHYSVVNNQAAAVDGLIRYWNKRGIPA